MQKLNDLSRSLTALEPDGTLIAVIEMSLSSWLVAGALPPPGLSIYSRGLPSISELCCKKKLCPRCRCAQTLEPLWNLFRQEQADEYAKEQADEAAKEAASEAYDEAYKEAYDEAYDEAYKEVYEEAFKAAYEEALKRLPENA